MKRSISNFAMDTGQVMSGLRCISCGHYRMSEIADTEHKQKSNLNIKFVENI